MYGRSRKLSPVSGDALFARRANRDGGGWGQAGPADSRRGAKKLIPGAGVPADGEKMTFSLRPTHHSTFSQMAIAPIAPNNKVRLRNAAFEQSEIAGPSELD